MSKRALTAAFAACLFALIVGAKWATFDRFGSAMPDWDQWDAEAMELFVPWFEHDHFVQHLFHPHNEHRVVLTKLQNLTLGLLNGQWDSRLEAATNAMLHAALAVGFWLCACRWLVSGAGEAADEKDKRKTRQWLEAGLFVLAAALFGLPLAWQNILGGFHSQQFWLLGLSFIAIVALPFARPWSARWWFAAVAALLALGSMGSGFLAAAVVLVVLGWRYWRRESMPRETWPTLAVSVALVVVGALTRVEVPWHQDLKAKTVHDFVFSIVHSLEWPLRDRDWAAAVMWLPWALVAWRLLAESFSREARDARARIAPQIVVALGGWVLVQVVATAYARGVNADYPASRYMDTLGFGAMVNGAGLAWLLSRQVTKRPKGQEAKGLIGTTAATRSAVSGVSQPPGPLVPWSLGLLVLITLGWLTTLGFGLHEITDRNLRYELPDAKKYYVKAEAHMRAYLGTNDPKQLAYPDIPFPSADGLVERLAKPSLRALMPVPIRTPMSMEPAGESTAFVANDARGTDVEHPPRAGLSPQTSPLDFTKSWGSFNQAGKGAGEMGTWRSAPLTSTLHAWLKFEVAGHAGNPNGGVALELHDAATDALLAQIRPDHVPGDAWRAAYVRAPAQPFVVVAHDQHAARWLAFSGPAEMGRLSYWAWRATKLGLLLVFAATAMMIALIVVSVFSRRRHSDERPSVGEDKESSTARTPAA